MLEQRLIYLGNGRYQTASRSDLENANTTFAAGEHVVARITHKRSVRQNNTFHAMIAYAFENQRSGPNLSTAQHLKQWLLIKAGHYSERRFHLGPLLEREAKSVGMVVAQMMRSHDDYVGIAYASGTGELIERRAKSVSFKSVMSDDMRELFDRVVHIICEEIMPGVDPDALVEEAKSSGGRRRAA